MATVRYEYPVPAKPPFGAAAAEVAKAWAVADRDYRKERGIPESDSIPDNAISFTPGDDEIVISYETRSTS